jgi:hypothetical protein
VENRVRRLHREAVECVDPDVHWLLIGLWNHSDILERHRHRQAAVGCAVMLLGVLGIIIAVAAAVIAPAGLLALLVSFGVLAGGLNQAAIGEEKQNRRRQAEQSCRCRDGMRRWHLKLKCIPHLMLHQWLFK